MNRFVMMTVAVVMLAAGGNGAERDAAKESPIDWPARAAMVKDGMTRAEVEKILPPPLVPQSDVVASSTGYLKSYPIPNGYEVWVFYWEDPDGPHGFRARVMGPAQLHASPKVVFVSAKEDPIDWPARAATVKEGMTPAEVEKILPRWESARKIEKARLGITKWPGLTVVASSQNRWGSKEYQVAEDWRVLAFYFSDCSDDPQKMGLTRLCINKIMRSLEDKKEWMATAATIKVGMTRAEAQRNIPAWHDQVPECLWNKAHDTHELYRFADNWLQDDRATNYTWSLTIDYDGSGGQWSAENRVINPVKIATFEKPIQPKPTP